MTTLNEDQAAAEAAFIDFKNSDDTLFALLGYAGTGKSFTEAYLLQNHILDISEARGFSFGTTSETLLAAPTHKAANVVRGFLGSRGIPFENGYDKFNHAYGTPILGTTAQLLGVRPVITEDQTDRKLNFGKVDGGLITKMHGVGWVIVDEVSMLSAADLNALVKIAREENAKVLVIGDPGQLPPVEAEAIDFDAIERKAVLQKIMRQTGDSAIPLLAKAIREQADWTAVTGPGVDHFDNPAGAFIDELDGPPDADETQRNVFIAYRNARVNAVQQAACMKVYGHGRLEVGPGEVLIANTPLLDQRTRMPVAVCNNGDVLTVVEVGEKGQYGKTVVMRRELTGREFTSEFLNEAELADRSHPFNVAKEEAGRKARALQAEFGRGDARTKAMIDPERRAAWQDFFRLDRSTILSASHPFAITSHKSQGSTYGNAFVDATDMAPFDHRALYVGATRPSKELIIG